LFSSPGVQLDASWNPSHDDQAVFIYRLIIDNSMEKKHGNSMDKTLFDRQVFKKFMVAMLVGHKNLKFVWSRTIHLPMVGILIRARQIAFLIVF